MELTELSAISPIDGRYRKQVKSIASYFSEYGLIRYRVLVEVEYFIALHSLGLPQLKNFPSEKIESLRAIYLQFNEQDALKIKETEKITNHDVKAVEYFIKDKFELLQLSDYSEFIHFGLTSQDINNTSIPMLLRDALEIEVYPILKELVERIKTIATMWADVPMLAKTHGQPASPTRLGKEFLVFHERLEKQVALLKTISYAAKFGGATGNFNAHHVAYPTIDWKNFADNFVNNVLKLSRSTYTTQIEHYDQIAALCDNLKRINTILLDFDRDVWQYVSMNYFKQKIKEGEVGSSAMPHKVNPIDFENSEGNLGIANALFEHFSAKLPISRLQRDLTDSTVLRNIGMPIAHTLLAIKSTIKGIDKLELNQQALKADLEDNWAVVAEAIQTILRREGYPKPYEALKALTRKNEKITAATIKDFVVNLSVSESIKAELLSITPYNYTGL